MYFRDRQKKVKYCQKLGYKNVYNPLKIKDIDKIKKIYPLGFDGCIESAGHKSSIELGFSLINAKSGKLIFSSHPAKNTKISIDPHELIKGKKF